MLACLAWLIFAAGLEPNPHGAGTHQQLGLASQCSFEADYGFACPTCGMTTAFVLATHGRLIDAALVQPAGALLALAVAMTAWVTGFVAFTGCPVRPWLRPIRQRWPWLSVSMAFVVLVGWLTQLSGG